jgi:hypothetical protein
MVKKQNSNHKKTIDVDFENVNYVNKLNDNLWTPQNQKTMFENNKLLSDINFNLNSNKINNFQNFSKKNNNNIQQNYNNNNNNFISNNQFRNNTNNNNNNFNINNKYQQKQQPSNFTTTPKTFNFNKNQSFENDNYMQFYTPKVTSSRIDIKDQFQQKQSTKKFQKEDLQYKINLENVILYYINLILKLFFLDS